MGTTSSISTKAPGAGLQLETLGLADPQGKQLSHGKGPETSCFGKLRCSSTFHKTSQLLGMGEQSCAELRGTGAPWTGNAAMQLQSSLYGLTRKKLNQRQHISKGSFLPCVLIFP